MRDGIRISIIVPVYNCEKYIHECLDSIRQQTLQSYEILVVDDCSTDDTLQIVREEAEFDKRLRVIGLKENKGVSNARNIGMDASTGEYLFFMDGDDLIHPSLLENYLNVLEKTNASAAACNYKLFTSGQHNKVEFLMKDLDSTFDYVLLNHKETQKAFCFPVKGVKFTGGMGGVMIRKDVIDGLKFNTDIRQGEDTVFLVEVLSADIGTVIARNAWYFYRQHDQNNNIKMTIPMKQSYIFSYTYLKNLAVKMGDTELIRDREYGLLSRISQRYTYLKVYGDDENSLEETRKRYIEELHSEEFALLSKNEKIRHYIRLAAPSFLLRVWSHRVEKMNARRIGILTFHCADNFGAMLQAYGLQKALKQNGYDAEIVNYCPPYMTGRHWLIGYCPADLPHVLLESIRNLRRNFRHRTEHDARRKFMSLFRKKYLTFGKKKYFRWQLKSLPYNIYVLGSDQIWNPEITFGLRPEYFGDINSRFQYRRVAYAASFGGSRIGDQYKEELSALMKKINAISVREESAVEFAEEVSGKKVTSVLDPVFLPEKTEWNALEKEPVHPKWSSEVPYILYYETEKRNDQRDYCRRLAEEKGLRVIELVMDHNEKKSIGNDYIRLYAAGPAEFLYLVHHAEYVVTNSFHATAFSLIYHKQFVVFSHATRGARLFDLLKNCEMDHRMISGSDGNISLADDEISWNEVDSKLEEQVVKSKLYIFKNV